MIIQISSGQGPVECQLAVGLLMNALQEEYADMKVISAKAGRERGCYISAMLRTEENLSELEGSVLWICKSPFRPNHGRKNWYVDVSVIPEAGDINTDEEYQVETMRSGGHGGQNVNKVESGVRVRHIPTGITVVCMEERSQYMNKQKAIKRIQEQLKERKENELAQCRNAAWKEHTKLVRGNPVRVYEGLGFARRV